ncbi:MAG: hypothetical protein CMF70_12350 [Magnetovibrio sp.]|nr:hypothetical protein [Magnetovibrio sp.]
MTLFGSLTSGVSGLTAQSSAMGAISDNITNINTIGYKSTEVSFQNLVTVQTSATFYSAGGVQSKPRQNTGLQGLLQSSTSQTDLAVSGAGYFVVNEAALPTLSDQYLFTRAGSFYQDEDGYLRNTAGFYLQGWPTDASGNVTTANTSLTIPNQNIMSTDYLSTINLNRVGGTAAPTTTVAIGANLPSSDAKGTTHKSDVQFFDTLGNAHTMSYTWTKTGRDNEWDITATPPMGVNTVTLYSDTAGSSVYESIGQLEFTGTPANDSIVKITQTENVSGTATAVTLTYQFDTSGSASDTTLVKQVNVSTATTVAQHVAALEAKIKAVDSNFTDHGGFTNDRVNVAPGNASALYFTDDGTGAMAIDPSGLLTSTGAYACKQEETYTVSKTTSTFRDYHQFSFDGVTLQNTATIIINGITYTLSNAEGSSDNDTTIRMDSIANFLSDLEASIEANDPRFAAGAANVRIRHIGDHATSLTATAYNTLVIDSMDFGSFNIKFSAAWSSMPKEPDGTATYVANTDFAINKANGITFDSKGLPTAFNVSEVDISGLDTGAANFDDDSLNTFRQTLDLGTVSVANGFTQFGAEFTPGFITQNGSAFGNFAGITVNTSGLVTALFDNGETRPVYKVPVATFVNVNGLSGRTGTVWNQTEASGDYTLREADNGVAGQTIQASLESSTVDIGDQFTKMIIVQRAFSASTKIISTADEMLEELLRVKR